MACPRKRLLHLVPVFFLVTFASFTLVDFLPRAAFGIVATPPFVTAIPFVRVFAVVPKALPADGRPAMQVPLRPLSRAHLRREDLRRQDLRRGTNVSP